MNVRSSRSFPFVSKVTKYPLIEKLADCLLGNVVHKNYESLELDYVGVKTAQFSYHRLKGSNPVAHVEMASTGEVACLGQDLFEAFLNSYLASDQEIKGKRILVSIGGDQKGKLLPAIQKLDSLGWEIYATENTHHFLSRAGIPSTFLYKAQDKKEPSVLSAILNQEVDLIINISSRHQGGNVQSDGFKVRRMAIDCHIPLITNLQLAQILMQSLTQPKVVILPKALHEYHPQEYSLC